MWGLTGGGVLDGGDRSTLKVAVFPVIADDLSRDSLRAEGWIESYQIPLVDPGAHVLTHPGGSQPLQAGHIRWSPSERVSVQLFQHGVGAVELVVIGWLKEEHVIGDVAHPGLGKRRGLVPFG